MALVEIREVVRRYHKGDETITPLDGVSLDIEAGEFVSLMGASGSGNNAERSRSKRSPMVSECPRNLRSRRSRHFFSSHWFNASQPAKRGIGTKKFRRA